MKLVYLLLILIILVSVSAALKQPRNLFNDVLSRRLKHTFVTAPSSTCGNTNCSSSNDCPNFPFITSTCMNDFCEYNDTSDQRVCTEPSECGTSPYCDCDQQSLSDGCKCTSNDTCESQACFEGTCRMSHGYPKHWIVIGSFCWTDNDCSFGVCNKSNICELVSNGGSCNESTDCELTLYCDTDSLTCIQRPPCNETTTMNGDIGYCPVAAICYEGACIPFYIQAQGESCLVQDNCQPGLACANNQSESLATCQPVPFGTPCDTSEECAFMAQECLCSEPDDSSPTVCMDGGLQLCKQEATDYFSCVSMNNCIVYDASDPSTECYKKCYPLLVNLNCCGICRYPEYADNAYINLSGSCADNTLTFVDCCSPTTPCTILETSKMCAGY